MQPTPTLDERPTYVETNYARRRVNDRHKGRAYAQLLCNRPWESKHSENIAKIDNFDGILFVLKSCVRRHAERHYAIYRFPNCSIVFSGQAWLIYRAGCCSFNSVAQYSHVSRPPEPKPQCTLSEPWRHSDGESLGAPSLRNNANRGSLSSGLPCGADIVGRCVRSSDVFVQVKSSSVRRQQEQAPWRLSEIGSSQKMKEPGNEVPRDRFEQGCYWAVIVRTENKNPSKLFTTFIVFLSFFLS